MKVTPATPLQIAQDSLRAIVKQGADACTCESWSWYGKGHDSSCPISIAKNALTEMRRLHSNKTRRSRDQSMRWLEG